MSESMPPYVVEAIGTSFMAAAVVEALEVRESPYLDSQRQAALVAGLEFMANVFRGFLLNLPRSEARLYSDGLPSLDPAYTSAFRYAVKVWLKPREQLDNQALAHAISECKAVLEHASKQKPRDTLPDGALERAVRFFQRLGAFTTEEARGRGLAYSRALSQRRSLSDL